MRGQWRRALALENLTHHVGFVRATGQEHHFGGAIEHGESESDPVSIELRHPICDHQPRLFSERRRIGEERCGVAIGTEAEKNQVKAREFAGFDFKESAELSFVVRGSGGGIGILSGHAKDV